MRVCGVELKGNEANIVMLEGEKSDWAVIACPIRKLALEDDEDVGHVRSFANAFEDVVKEYAVRKIAIKKRSKKGTYAGGPVSFKMEGIIQLVSPCDVSLLTSASITNYLKKNPAELPEGFYNYQKTAFDVARTSLGRGM